MVFYIFSGKIGHPIVMIYQTQSLGNFDEVKMLTGIVERGVERVGLRSYRFFLPGLIVCKCRINGGTVNPNARFSWPDILALTL